jgi:hypothetical protein
MNEWAELDRALDAMASSGSAEIREDGQWLAELTGLHCEFRAEGKNPLVHLWSDERNLTRRILRVREQSQDRIILEVQRFGRTKPGRLEFLRTDSPRPSARVAREQFRARFERFLTERFPDAEVDSLSAAPDLEHSFSGLYVRGRMREGAHFWAFLAVSPRESAATMSETRLRVEGSDEALDYAPAFPRRKIVRRRQATEIEGPGLKPRFSKPICR